jgi:glycosyltransferase involved in cell wall biosynthesis
MKKNLYFISKDANWQHYRNEVLTYLASRYDLNVEVLTTGTLKSYLKENAHLKYKVFKNCFSDSAKFNFFPGALFYIIKNRPQYVLALNNAANITEYVSCVMCFFMKTKFVWWTHGYDHKPVKGKLKRKVKNLYTSFFFRLSNSIITFSEPGKLYLTQIGIVENKIFVAPNTLDTDKLLSLKEKINASFDRNEFLKKNIPNAAVTDRFILFSGRINKYKKVDNLIRVLDLILKKEPQVHLIIIGDGEQKNNVEKLSKELHLTSNVHFKGAIFDEVVVGKYFVLCDVFVIPGLVGLAIVHAFCYGKPLITENVSYHSPEIQYLKNGVNGFIVEENDLKEMSEKILSLLQNADKLKQMSIDCVKTIEENASISFMTSSMYKALMHQR